MLSVSLLSLDSSNDTLGKSDNLKMKNMDGFMSSTDNGFDFRFLDEKPRPIQPIDTRRSLDEKSFNDILGPRITRPSLQTVTSQSDLEGMVTPSSRSASNTPRGSCLNTPRHMFEPHPMTQDAWEALRRSLVYYKGSPVGTIAALDPNEESLNYNQV
jgi:hypothetical protein